MPHYMHFEAESCPWPNPEATRTVLLGRSLRPGPRPADAPPHPFIAAMHRQFGVGSTGRSCGECACFYVARVRAKHGGEPGETHSIFGCRVQRAEGRGIAKNREPIWAKRWPACARFQERAS